MRGSVPLAVVRSVMRRPLLWPEALRAATSFVRKGWWRRPPFLPLPDREYLAWRVSTAYGSDDAAVAPDDVVGYLEWRRRQRS